MTSEGSEKAVFQFEGPEPGRLTMVDGVWGGATPKGFVNANFYVDLPRLPVSVTFAVKASNEPIEQASVDGPSDDPKVHLVRRIVVSSLILTPADAISIGEWMINMGRTVLAAQGQAALEAGSANQI